ncbi:hypothetical protein RBI13_03580 [Alcaligenaceae bacterium A4P071]|nr:hypothetical protein [Alcaligenaceae bacterium A4P071]
MTVEHVSWYRSVGNVTANIAIFPVLPIAVIWGSQILMNDLWIQVWYPPGEDGAEAEPALALFGIPLVLMVIALVLAALPAYRREFAKHHWMVPWYRVAIGVVRVVLVAIAIMLFVVAAGFFVSMTPPDTFHWQTPVGYTMIAITVAAILFQQWRQLNGKD